MKKLRGLKAKLIAGSRLLVLLVCAGWFQTSRQAYAQIYYWTTFAGRAGVLSGQDGVGNNAFFNQPSGGAMDAAGNFYVADEYNDAIRKIAPDGTVTTFAGTLGVAGTNDGTGGSARFTQPTNLTLDRNGNLYVVDTYAYTIRKITPVGVVTTLAGLGNAPGSNDGTGSAARFYEPNGIAYDTTNNVFYVADGRNGAIRKVTLAGVVTTVAGGGTTEGQLFYGVEQVAVTPGGRLYVCDAYNSTIWQMDTNGANLTVLAGPGAGNNWPIGSGSADGTGTAAQFSFPESLWLDSVGNAFVADYNNSTIRKVTPAGVVTTVGGKPGVIGTADGTNSAARFNLMEGIFVDPWGNLYVADTQNSTIRIGYAGPPVILTSPQSLTVPVGASPAFSVSAAAAAPQSAYQWRCNGVVLTNSAHISGANSNVLALTSVTTNNAGTYQVTVTNAAGPTNVSATLAVNQLTPALTWPNPAAILYGTTLSSTQLNATANVPGSFAYAPPVGSVLNAGTNLVTTVFTPTDTSDYRNATGTVSLVVLPAPLTVTASNASRFYGQFNPVFGGTLAGLQNADNITASYTTLATNNSPVGTYAILPALVDPDNRLPNYTVTTNNGLLTINKATPTITTPPTASTITYGQTLAISTLSGGAASVPGTFAFTIPSLTPDAGTALQSVAFTPTDTTDYNAATLNVSVTVLQATPTLTWTNPAAILYGIALSSTQLNATANVLGSFIYTPPAGSVLNAGTNILTTVFTAADPDDYGSATGTVSLVVLPAALTVTASNAARFYGQPNPVVGGTLSGLQNADNITATYTTPATNNSPVGTYPIISALVDPNNRLPNYTVTTNNGLLTINKATPTITNLPTASTIIYGQTLANSTLSGGVSVPGTFAFTTPSLAPDAGTGLQSFIFTPTDTTDYGNTTGTVSLVVLPAALTVSASNVSRFYGQSNPVFGGTLIGLQNADNIAATYTTPATNNSAVGTYPIIPALVDPNNRLPNYTVTTNNGLLTINKATPAITNAPTASMITYGQSLTSCSLSGGGASVPGTFAFTTPSLAPDAGTALQSVTFTPTDTTDYNTVTTNVAVTILQAAPSLSWTNPAAILYGTALSSTQLNATADVPGSFIYTPPAGSVLNAGTNILTTVFTPADSSDYSDATGTVNLVVLPSSLAVTADNVSRAYGATNPPFTATYSGFVNGQSLTNSDVTGAPLLTSLADTNSPVGAYVISASLGSLTATNYTFTLTDGTLTVTSVNLTITASNATKPYGQTKNFAGTEFNASGLQNTDSVTQVTLSSLGAPTTAAIGNYPIVATNATGNGLSNYTIAYVDGVLDVTPPTPVIINAPLLLGDGTIRLTFSGGDPQTSYRLQANSDLNSSNWLDLATILADTNGLPPFIDLNATNLPARFYRTLTP